MVKRQRESMTFDVVIVGAGPAGLSTAIRIMQLADELGRETSVCVLEKGSEIGAHILSGAVIDTRGLDDLFPSWKELEPPLTRVTEDRFQCLVNDHRAIAVPRALIPRPSRNDRKYVTSLGNLCRWMAQQAEKLGVMLFPGFAATEILYDKQNKVIGVATGDMGVDRFGKEKTTHEPGLELLASYTVFAEGCRGHLGKQLIAKFDLDKKSSPQHYAIGLKELWEVPAGQHKPGRILHTIGWPLGFSRSATGGGFMYHMENQQIALGLIVDLSYSNPYLDPFSEFQVWKHHPIIKEHLLDGRRISYGARAITKGGYGSLPDLAAAGAVLVGDDAGFLNPLKIKGTHTAMKSGKLAAEAIMQALSADRQHDVVDLQRRYEKSWLHGELYQARNVGPAWHQFGMLGGSAWAFLEQNVFNGWNPIRLKDTVPDHERLRLAKLSKKITYSKPDGVYSFDKNSSVYLSNTNHEDDQPCHLLLEDADLPIRKNLRDYAEPAQRYCPAGVYEVIGEEGEEEFQINAQNCVHCKTCDIKDPSQNITWVAPEGSGGPNYPNM